MATISINKMALILVVLLFQCKKPGADVAHKLIKIDSIPVLENHVTLDTIMTTAKLDEFKNDVINKGDNYSFSMLSIELHAQNKFDELLKYSLIMGNQFKKGDGFNEAFLCMVALHNNNVYEDISDFEKIPEDAKETALNYLEKGVALGDINSASMLQEIYRKGIGVKVNVKKADELKKLIEKQ